MIFINIALWIFWLSGGFLLLFLIFVFNIYPDKQFAPIGILLSAFIASMSLMKSIAYNKKKDDAQSLKAKDIELKYMLHTLIKVDVTSTALLESINNGALVDDDGYSDISLEKIRLDMLKFMDKLDSKKLFYYLPYNSIGQIMNVIARLGSIAYSIEIHKDDREAMTVGIKNNLNSHKSGHSLLPLLEELIKHYAHYK